MFIKVLYNDEEKINDQDPIPASYNFEIVSDDAKKNCNFNIEYKEFQKLLQKSFEKYDIQDISSAESSNVNPDEDVKAVRDKIRLTGYLVEEIEKLINTYNLDLSELINTDRKIIISADKDEILGLFWERIIEKYNLKGQILVVREYSGNEQKKSEQKFNNIIVFYSHAFIDNDNKLDKISEDFYTETESIVKPIINNNKGDHKPSQLKLIKYLNAEVFSNCDIKDYNILHLILHGSEEGELGFENLNNHQEIKWMNIDNFITLLEEKSQSLNLIFYSCCFSAFSYNSAKESLAFKTLKNNLSKYCIAFNGPIGSSKTMPEFVSRFYEVLSIRNDIEESFSRACGAIKEKEYWDKAILYRIPQSI